VQTNDSLTEKKAKHMHEHQGTDWMEFNLCDLLRSEVIGNIHENSELLES